MKKGCGWDVTTYCGKLRIPFKEFSQQSFMNYLSTLTEGVSKNFSLLQCKIIAYSNFRFDLKMTGSILYKEMLLQHSIVQSQNNEHSEIYIWNWISDWGLQVFIEASSDIKNFIFMYFQSGGICFTINYERHNI